MKSDFQKLLLNYAASLMVVVIVFCSVVEVGTRAISFIMGKGFTLNVSELDPYDAGVEGVYKFHPFTGFVYRPSQTFSSGHPSSNHKSIIKTDGWGFLSDKTKLSIAKEQNEIRIALIGASTTACVNRDFPESWAGVLKSTLRKELPDRKITIINAAVPGYDTAQSISNLALRVMPFRPDIVVVYHAYNDLKAVTTEGDFNPDYSHIHKKPYGFHKKPPVFILLLNKSMAYVRVRNLYRERKKSVDFRDKILKAERVNMVPAIDQYAFMQHIEIITNIAKSFGAETVLSSFATLHDPTMAYNHDTTKNLSELKKSELYQLLYYTPSLDIEGIFDGINKYNKILKNIATKKKALWVDNAALVPHEDKYFIDRIHFSKEGNRLMGENFATAILRHLSEKNSR